MRKPDLSIVFPVMNQADHIESVIRSYHKALSKEKLSFELIAVVNGTKDDSYKICQKVTRELSNVSSYELKGSGFGLGILYGLKKAKGKYLCYVNCARVWPDELVMCLKYFLVDPKIIVHAIRRNRDTPVRTITSIVYNGFCRLLFNIYYTDINGNPKIFSRKYYDLMKLRFTNSMIDLEFQEKAKTLGIRTIEIPIYKNNRHGGRSTSSWKTSFRLMREVMDYWVKTRQS